MNLVSLPDHLCKKKHPGSRERYLLFMIIFGTVYWNAPVKNVPVKTGFRSLLNPAKMISEYEFFSQLLCSIAASRDKALGQGQTMQGQFSRYGS